MGDDIDPREGMVPAVVATIAAVLVACFLILAGTGLARCSRPSTTIPLVTPNPVDPYRIQLGPGHHLPQAQTMVIDHGRLGVVALTAPGILAADLELVRADVSPWLLGTPLELGLDVAANTEIGAVGVTAGGKAFTGLYGWSRWNLQEQGAAVGVGLRF